MIHALEGSVPKVSRVHMAEVAVERVASWFYGYVVMRYHITEKLL